MNGFTKLFQSILTSSVWSEDNETRIVWITLLALADQNGSVSATIPGLSRLAGVPIPAVEAALAKFQAPDPYSRTPDFEGRRVVKAEGGWRLINYPKYRHARDDEARRMYERERKQSQRDQRRKVRDSPGQSGTITQCPSSSAQAEAEAEAEAESPPSPLQGGSGGPAGAENGNGELPGMKPTPKRFQPPTREELDLEAAKIGLPATEVDKFVAYYGSNGWKVGKSPMKSWPHALAGWAARWRERAPNGNHAPAANGNHYPGRAPGADRNRFIMGADDVQRAVNAKVAADQLLAADPDFIPFG
jgi:hypothetical protein